MELRKLGREGKIRMATVSHPLTRLALLLRGDEVDNLRFRLHLPNDLADLFLLQLGLGEPDAVERASHVQRSINHLGLGTSGCPVGRLRRLKVIHAGDVLDDAVACVVPDVHAARDALSSR
jgi:hypothetical protein